MGISKSCIVALLIGVVACGGGKPKPTAVTGTGDGSSVPAVAPKRPVVEFRVEMVAGGAASAEGMMRDRAKQEPLIGATVVVTSPALQGEQVTITDDTGRFVFAVLPPGAYKLTTYYSDQTASGEFEVQTGKLAKISLDWDLTAGGDGEVVVIDQKPPEFKSAIEALSQGALGEAVRLGQAELAKKPSSKLHGTLALARYGSAIETFRVEGFAFGGNSRTAKDFRNALASFSTALDQVREHLVAAEKDPKFVFEFCVACMATEKGYLLLVPPGALDIERDRSLKELPEGDPRRRPTYRFDHGDLAWGRAMIHYQQALVNVALAYDWDWIDKLIADEDAGNVTKQTKITIKLVEPARIDRARELILAGLAASDEARLAFLAETDDDREWVPSPKQKSYASPLAVDAQLYKTWEDVVADVRLLVGGETGVSLKALWAVFGAKREAPAGFIDVGAMLKTPKDIVFELGVFDKIENEKNAAKRGALTTALLKGVLGNGHKATMKPSKLTDRLIQLRKDLDGADAAFEDKLKYVLWLN